jgi:Tfp pilus assembly pilus retraction ATPase PilT
MDYPKLVGLIPTEKRKNTADRLVDLILSSKSDNKMPSDLANTILYQWQQNLLSSEHGLSTLLKAAILLEQEKALLVLEELQLKGIADEIRKGV